ncbi:hypothetical protein E2P64_07575 [Candidatus Bathyarchaeota archaeon]|nr:hypothetical protein E2P64_07575 [Candidatus Bathyarchaeota archaeon]
MLAMVCSYPNCMAKAKSRLPLMHGKIHDGELPVCHEAEHVVWGGGRCYDFGQMSEGERQEYLQTLAEELKHKILAKMELIGK